MQFEQQAGMSSIGCRSETDVHELQMRSAPGHVERKPNSSKDAGAQTLSESVSIHTGPHFRPHPPQQKPIIENRDDLVCYVTTKIKAKRPLMAANINSHTT